MSTILSIALGVFVGVVAAWIFIVLLIFNSATYRWIMKKTMQIAAEAMNDVYNIKEDEA